MKKKEGTATTRTRVFWKQEVFRR